MAIQFRRGTEADLDISKLLTGEPAYTTDSKRLYIANGDGSVRETMFIDNYAAGTGATNANKVDHAMAADSAGALNNYPLAVPGNYWGAIPVINSANGVMEIGKYIDFHETDGDTSDYSARMYSSSGRMYFSGGISGIDLYMSGRGGFTGSSYPQIYGDGIQLQLCHGIDANQGLVISSAAIRPAGDNVPTLGSSSHRWGQIYSSTSTISTSDRNEKNSITPIDEQKAVEFIAGLNPVSYKYNDGTSGRTHNGMIAQDVEDEMTNLGMTTFDFAGLIKSPKIKETSETVTEQVPVTDSDGTTTMQDVQRQILHEEIIPDEYRYGLRYEEFIAPIIKTIQGLLTRCAALEAIVRG